VLSVKFFSIISGKEDEVCNRARASWDGKKSGFASRVNPPRNPNNSPQTQDDPHKLRRLRRPTGPQRAALRAL